VRLHVGLRRRWQNDDRRQWLNDDGSHPDGRQFKSREEYVAYYSRAYGWTEARTDAVVGKKLRRKQHESRRLEVAVRELAEAARTCGAVLASHDDELSGRHRSGPGGSA